MVQRLAGTVFLIRVAGAVLAFGSQVLFARWMGTFEFGIYVYAWTWVMLPDRRSILVGTAAQRFIPEYRERGMVALLRDFVSGSRWVAIGVAICISAVGAGGVRCWSPISTITWPSRSISPASPCRPLRSPTPLGRLRAATTGSGWR